MPDKRSKTSVDQAGTAAATGRPKAAVETSGIDDMKKPQNFRERQGRIQALGRILIFAFCSLFIVLLRSGTCQA
jgi:hypothetical protein